MSDERLLEHLRGLAADIIVVRRAQEIEGVPRVARPEDDPQPRALDHDPIRAERPRESLARGGDGCVRGAGSPGR